MAAKNANDALGLLKVVENATNDVTDMLQRIRELAVQAASGTNSDTDVSNLQLEAEALMDEITRVSSDTSYNGTFYLAASGSTNAVSVQVGYNDGDVIQVQTYDVSASKLGTSDSGTLTISLTDGTDQQITDGSHNAAGYLDISKDGALEVISDAIDQVASYKAEWGAGQNRLQYTVANLMNVVEFTTAARSRIQDADFAVEAARLAKAQVLQQTGTAMLAQANAAPQLALQLLK